MISKELIRHADKAAEFLTLLGNSKRLAIMSHLLESELSVGAIAEKVSLSQSALSQHLAKLRSLQLVETRRDRQMIYYSCKSDEVRRLFPAATARRGCSPSATSSKARCACARIVSSSASAVPVRRWTCSKP